jgi:hypothetical protein
MDPVTGGLLGGAILAPIVGGIMQANSADKGRKASAEEMAIARELLAKVKDPNFTIQDLSPVELKLIGQYEPQVSAYIAEQRPELLEANSEGAVAGRDAQMKALQRFQQLSERGVDEYSNILNQEALRAAQIQNQGQQQAILQGMARRGVGAGSGLEFAAQLGAQQQANQSANQSTMDAAKQAYLTRLNALSQGANLGGQIRQEDIQLEGRNKDVINAFNQRNTAAFRDYLANRDNVMNQAQLRNLQERQRVADSNALNRYNNDARNMEYRNQMEQQGFENRYRKAGGQAQGHQMQAQAYRQDALDKNNIISGISGGLSSGALAAASMYGRQQQPSLAGQQYKAVTTPSAGYGVNASNDDNLWGNMG